MHDKANACFNQIIAEGARILVKPIGREGDGRHGLGIPADVNLFARKRGLPAVMP